jgi:hypothetical protein
VGFLSGAKDSAKDRKTNEAQGRSKQNGSAKLAGIH